MFRMRQDRLQAPVEATASTRRGWGGARLSICLVLSIVMLGLGPVSALASDNKDLASDAGIGVGSALVSLVYAPTKIAYALGGLVVGGLAWVFSGGDGDVASIILTPSLRGDYVVTPRQLQGKEPVQFFGRKPEYDLAYEEVVTPRQDVAAAPADEQLW